MTTVLYNLFNPSDVEFVSNNPSLSALVYSDGAVERYPYISDLPAIVDAEGNVFCGVTTLEGLPLAPDAAAFYNALASSDEYTEILGFAASNPTTPISLFIGIAIAACAEAKSYQQSGGANTSFNRVDAALKTLISVLPEEVGDITKSDIIEKIKQIAANNNVILPSM